MEIVNFGHFTLDNPDSEGILFYVNEDGQDWYGMRHALTTWDPRGKYVDAVYGAWALVSPDGIVTNVEQDPSRLVPDNKTVLGIDASHKDIKQGMVWDGKELTDGNS